VEPDGPPLPEPEGDVWVGPDKWLNGLGIFPLVETESGNRLGVEGDSSLYTPNLPRAISRSSKGGLKTIYVN